MYLCVAVYVTYTRNSICENDLTFMLISLKFTFHNVLDFKQINKNNMTAISDKHNIINVTVLLLSVNLN